jgi:hypothetical protein
VIDGLDEARGQAFTIARDLLARLAPYAVIVVATRDLRASDRDPSRTLVGALDPVEVVNLDSEQWVDSGRAALADYVVARLEGFCENEIKTVDQGPLAAKVQVQRLFAAARGFYRAGHLAEHIDVCAAKSVDRLLPITDDKEIRAAPQAQLHL